MRYHLYAFLIGYRENTSFNVTTAEPAIITERNRRCLGVCAQKLNIEKRLFLCIFGNILKYFNVFPIGFAIQY